MFVFDRHIMWRYLEITALLLFCLVVMIAVSMVVEDVRLFARSENATAGTMLAILGLRSVIYSHQMMPMAAFLGVLVWGALTARKGELIAAYVGGYSPRRLARPLLLAAALLAGATFVTGEYLVPWAANALVRIRSFDLYGKAPLAGQLRRRATWYRDGDHLLNLPRVDLERREFHDPRIFRIDALGAVQDWWQARTLARADGVWELRQGVHHALALDGEVHTISFARFRLPLTVAPQDLLDISGKPEQLTLGQLGETIMRRRRTGRQARFHELHWHQRFVYPLGLLVLVLISLPLALAPRRDRGLTGAMGSGRAVAGLAYSITYLFQSMVAAGDIAPAWGAWLPAAVTAVAATAIYLVARRLTGLSF